MMIIRGIKAVLQYTGIPKCIIGIENNAECIDLLCKKTQGDSFVQVKPCPVSMAPAQSRSSLKVPVMKCPTAVCPPTPAPS